MSLAMGICEALDLADQELPIIENLLTSAVSIDVVGTPVKQYQIYFGAWGVLNIQTINT